MAKITASKSIIISALVINNKVEHEACDDERNHWLDVL